MDTTKATANRVTEARKSAGLTLQALSDQSGVPYATLHRKLSGRTPFNVEELASIARVLDVPAASLVAFGDVA